MAKLTDVVSKFETAAGTISGMNFLFGYLFEMNEIQNKGYPLALLTPPSSVIPDYNNPVENYQVELYILQEKTRSDTTALETIWEQLKDWAWDIIDQVVARGAGSPQYYMPPNRTVNITPYAQQGNDVAPGIKVTFTLQVKDCRNMA